MPSRDTVKKIKAQLKRKADYVFFFENLKSASWAQPLFDEGFFRDPPQAEKNGESIRFVPWPESRFLARVAKEAPEGIIQIANQIPQTDNPRVHEDLLSIALDSPAQLAKSLVPTIIKSIQLPYSWGGYRRFAELVSHLAKGGETVAALDVAKTLLGFQRDPEETAKRAKHKDDKLSIFLRPEPRPRFDPYTYQQIVEKALPDLSTVAPVETVRLVSSILDQAITWGRFDPESENCWDGSFYWQPSLDDSSHRAEHEPKAALASGLVRTLDTILEKDLSFYPEVERILDSHKWKIFERILMRICRRCPEKAKERIKEFILDVADDANDFDHEFFILIKEHFGLLSPDEQRRFVQQMFSGPNVEEYRRNRKSWNETATEEQIEEFVRRWITHRIYPIKPYLNKDEHAKYERLLGSMSDPNEASYLHYRGSEVVTNFAWGPHSPKSSEELSSEEPRKVLDFLKTWEAVKGLNAPTPEGLARAFQQTVKGQPSKFSKEAANFEKIEPTYIRSLISGLAEAVKGGGAIDWQPVLKLCDWVVKQPVEIEGRSNESWNWDKGDPDWRGARKAIANLIQAGSYVGKGEISFELRETIFGILEILTEDDNPTREYEETGRSWKGQPATLAINSVRGDAMHALMSHAMWMHRHMHEKSPEQSNFAAMPEVAKVLERRLDLRIEKTYAIRSTYGQYFPYLCHIDRKWTVQHLDAIFPKEVKLKEYRNVAWWTYVTFNRPQADLFEILKEEYEHAVACISEDKGDEHDLGDPDEGLAQHLIAFYWWGLLSIEDVTGLLKRFYQDASDVLRAHAMTHIGSSLESHSGALPEETAGRLTAFWNWRLNEAKQNSGKTSCDKELLAFSWWIESGKFESEWSLKQILEALRICKIVGDEFVIIRFLAEIAKGFPEMCAECLLLIVTKLNREMSYLLDREEVRAILNNAATSQDPKVRDLVKIIRDSLLARGHFEFGNLG